MLHYNYYLPYFLKIYQNIYVIIILDLGIFHLDLGGNETHLNLNNIIKIEGCEFYRYLRANINTEGKNSEEIKYRI